MGKMIKSYSIFVLFLLISMSVFAKQNHKSNGNKAWIKKVEFLDENKVKINLITRTKKDIYSLTIEEIGKSGDITFLGWIKSRKKYINSWSIICDINLVLKQGDTTTISFKIKKNESKDGTNSIGGKNITRNISELVPSKGIEIKTYEDIHGWEIGERTTTKDSNIEYVFTKGGAGSYVEYPAIYVVIPEDKKIKKLKIETLDSIGNITGTKEINLSKKTGNIEIESNYFNFIEDEIYAYRVRVTPISKAKGKDDVEGESKILNFIVDTKIKNSYLEKEDIISELEVKEGKPIIKINLSKFEELSGINKYSYTLSNGLQTENKEGPVDGRKYLTPTEGNALDDIKIPLGDFSEGSRLTLSFAVYDRVGNKKTYEKTYFIPKESDRITAKVSGGVKHRNSKIKIITEGKKDKFGIGSNIDGSSEDETTIN